MIKKIGIITLSASDNCGSLLQCYALKKLLEPYGDVEVINFSSMLSHKIYDIPKVKLKDKIRVFLHLKKKINLDSLKKCKKDYQDFRVNQLEISGEEIFPENLREIEDKYDIVVAGSDQVWNVKMADYDESFFCDWVSSTKVAYAPSLGGHDIMEADNPYKIIEMLGKFKYLSVREEFGKKCLENILNKPVEKVLDPTLVLDKKYYLSLINEPVVKGDYIFYYSWAYCNEDSLNIVKAEAKRLNMPVIVVDARKWLKRDVNKYDFILSPEEGPLAFLNLMYHANQVYVESFHGMIFAYLFRKNFYLLDTHERFEELDSRLAEFVNLLGARDRIITKYNYNNIDFSKNVSYADNKLLSDLKSVSKEYIRKMIGD